LRGKRGRRRKRRERRRKRGIMSGKGDGKGEVLRTSISGLKTLTAEMPILDFAIPYAAPRQQSVMLKLHPIAPKKDFGVC
jgi:hypothetical protein